MAARQYYIIFHSIIFTDRSVEGLWPLLGVACGPSRVDGPFLTVLKG
jgi:hypothetical protein